MTLFLLAAYALAGVKASVLAFRFVLRDMGYPHYKVEGEDVAVAALMGAILGLLWPIVAVGYLASRVGRHYAASLNAREAGDE